MRRILLIAFVLSILPLSWAHGRDNIILYQVGVGDQASSAALKRYLFSKGYSVSLYEGTDNLEKQIQNANKMNKEKALFILAVEIVVSDKEAFFIAISDAKKSRGVFLEIDEVPGTHASESEELAGSVANVFGRKIKRLPLFPFLGVDLPGVFLRIECPKDKTGAVFDKLHTGVQNYLKRGAENENERKSE